MEQILIKSGQAVPIGKKKIESSDKITDKLLDEIDLEVQGVLVTLFKQAEKAFK